MQMLGQNQQGQMESMLKPRGRIAESPKNRPSYDIMADTSYKPWTSAQPQQGQVSPAPAVAPQMNPLDFGAPQQFDAPQMAPMQVPQMQLPGGGEFAPPPSMQPGPGFVGPMQGQGQGPVQMPGPNKLPGMMPQRQAMPTPGVQMPRAMPAPAPVGPNLANPVSLYQQGAPNFSMLPPMQPRQASPSAAVPSPEWPWVGQTTQANNPQAGLNDQTNQTGILGQNAQPRMSPAATGKPKQAFTTLEAQQAEMNQRKKAATTNLRDAKQQRYQESVDTIDSNPFFTGTGLGALLKLLSTPTL